ncbi:ROK family protein [Stakelama pacifica]|uniref:N-acetylglucosamine kinase n=1 Tax=Stakelama pacifica TaxID=517720 RepID=A0A4R6FRQ9_9SPHN|nr:ROK family protein [Stakelama pacifica]MAW99651.1 fructokinase [Sphingomonas sp.]TDN84456.1 N-acetylglucosamine kinase [Stakelama pacifica]GGO93758.1 glucokinase [Stakelama pacifica]
MRQLGIDLGGTKIEAAVLDRAGDFLTRIRIPNPGTYEATIRDLCDLVARAEAEAGPCASVGIGIPGSIDPRSRTMRNANATFLNGRTFREDFSEALGRPVRAANDANCLALSEALDGAAAGAACVFAIIIGTGVGGGLIVDGRIVEGGNGISGEWGHIPLPWMPADEYPGPDCWCGRKGCIETMVSGTGFQNAYEGMTGKALAGADIIAAARRGEAAAEAVLNGYIDRLARALAMLVDIVDPDVFVLGGGMSNVTELYEKLPALIRPHVFGGQWNGRIVPAKWGDSSGVRGAARLWSDSEVMSDTSSPRPASASRM